MRDLKRNSPYYYDPLAQASPGCPHMRVLTFVLFVGFALGVVACIASVYALVRFAL